MIKVGLSIICVVSCAAQLFSEIPNQVQNSVSQQFVMMSDGKESKAVPIEDFLKVALKDAGKNQDRETLNNILSLRQNIGRRQAYNYQEDLALQPYNGLDNTKKIIKKGILEDSFFLETLKDTFKGSEMAVKSIAKSVIKGIAGGATMGAILLVGGAIIWQIFAIPVYCKGPGPVFADWIPGLSDYWGTGDDGVCHDYAQSNKLLAQEIKLKHAAEVITQRIPAVILPDGSFNPEVPGYCKIDNGKVLWCDPSLCKIDKNLRGC